MPIILFDIDGTLVRTGGAGKFAMESALVEAFGVTELHDKVPYSGRTDTAIGRDLLRVHGIDPTPENQRKLRGAYLANLPGSLRTKGGTVCPGIPELLAAVANRPGVPLTRRLSTAGGSSAAKARRASERSLPPARHSQVGTPRQASMRGWDTNGLSTGQW